MQASSLSNAAAESATQRLRSIEGFQPKMGSLGKQAEQNKPSPAELTEFGITDEFLDFVRSLTYSTFRDFPADALPSPSKVCFIGLAAHAYAILSMSCVQCRYQGI